MKTLLKQAMLTLASMLWLQLPALATEVATRPLRAAALVKPNLVIAVDDSNSMFAELLLNTDTGYLWWSPTNGGWDSRGIFPVDITGMNYYAILFPFDGGIPFKELPPTKQFAFARSSAYNPIYYNPDVTYAPWPFGYYASTPYSFAAANPRAARIDMIRNSTTVDLTSTVCASNIQLQNGMVVDSGQMRGNNCSYSFPFDVSYQITATESLQQYLATYWVRQTCTVAMNDPSCAYAPDGIATLKRVEIKNGATFPSGRTYEAELQNFSNWFQYYRNRRLMLKGALGSTLERVSGMRVGVLSLHDFVQPTMYDTDGTDSSSNSRAAIGKVYWYDNTSGTPTRKILKHIGDQYSSNTSMIQYACQRNNTLIATDGYPNDSSLTPPAYNQSTWGSGAPYATTEAGTLADLALSYYTLNLRPTLASGRVPSSDSDKNTNLHMNTYAMSLGARGFLWPATAVPAVSTTPYAWPAAVFGYDSRYGIDELWHATINGRGQMYLATNPTDTANGLEAAFNAMTDQVGVQSAGAAICWPTRSRPAPARSAAPRSGLQPPSSQHARGATASSPPSTAASASRSLPTRPRLHRW